MNQNSSLSFSKEKSYASHVKVWQGLCPGGAVLQLEQRTDGMVRTGRSCSQISQGRPACWLGAVRHSIESRRFLIWNPSLPSIIHVLSPPPLVINATTEWLLHVPATGLNLEHTSFSPCSRAREAPFYTGRY